MNRDRKAHTSARRGRNSHVPPGWERVCEIFGDPEPPRRVWQRQFDGFNGELRAVAAMPLDLIQPQHLWYFLHDLAYVPLQPEVFDYLFPACLMFWRSTLHDGVPCSQGDADFHDSLVQGRILETMMDDERRAAVFDWLCDAMLDRIDAERGFDVGDIVEWPRPWGWVARLNTLARIAPVIESIWTRWWSFQTSGRAVASLEYVSGLIYFPHENPLFPELGRRSGTFPIEHADGLDHVPWTSPNAEFLRGVLTPDFIAERLPAAVERLEGEPEQEKARRVLDDLAGRMDILTIRIEDLVETL